MTLLTSTGTPPEEAPVTEVTLASGTSRMLPMKRFRRRWGICSRGTLVLLFFTTVQSSTSTT